MVSVLEFIASLAESLAWPLVVLFAVLVFRRQLVALVTALVARPLASLKVGPFEAAWEAWDQKVAAVEADLGPTPSPPPDSPKDDRVVDELVKLARTRPGDAVVMAFERIEDQLYQLLTDAGARPDRRSAPHLARQALAMGLVQEETVRAIEGIAELRNLAAHGSAGKLDQARALEYLALTEAISYALTRQRPPRGTTGQEPPPDE